MALSFFPLLWLLVPTVGSEAVTGSGEWGNWLKTNNLLSWVYLSMDWVPDLTPAQRFKQGCWHRGGNVISQRDGEIHIISSTPFLEASGQNRWWLPSCCMCLKRLQTSKTYFKAWAGLGKTEQSLPSLKLLLFRGRGLHKSWQSPRGGHTGSLGRRSCKRWSTVSNLLISALSINSLHPPAATQQGAVPVQAYMVIAKLGRGKTGKRNLKKIKIWPALNGVIERHILAGKISETDRLQIERFNQKRGNSSEYSFPDTGCVALLNGYQRRWANSSPGEMGKLSQLLPFLPQTLPSVLMARNKLYMSALLLLLSEPTICAGRARGSVDLWATPRFHQKFYTKTSSLDYMQSPLPWSAAFC